MTRQHPPKPQDLIFRLADIDFPVNHDVPEMACLPLPDNYRLPEHGQLAEDIKHALIAMRRGRSLFIHGLPGSGKDALAHALSAYTRTPAIIRAIKPGVDIQSWFYTRGFDSTGTVWETGPLFDALTKGYEVRDDNGDLIRRVPYMVVISDFDRADRGQAEYLRLIMDSIQGRVEGPQGRMEPVLPGTLIIATGNSAGSGDQRGRCVSSNVLDASILDRFNATLQFHWIDWKDEEKIVKAKFPSLDNSIYPIMSRITASIRTAIERDSLYAEFSHRAVCAILEHAEDIQLLQPDDNRKVSELFRMAARVWLDRLGDDVTREEAIKLMDPHVEGGMIPKKTEADRLVRDMSW